MYIGKETEEDRRSAAVHTGRAQGWWGGSRDSPTETQSV